MNELLENTAVEVTEEAVEELAKEGFKLVPLNKKAAYVVGGILGFVVIGGVVFAVIKNSKKNKEDKPKKEKKAVSFKIPKLNWFKKKAETTTEVVEENSEETTEE